MTEKVLLTGVSGWIAKHTAIELLNSGYEVLGTVRNKNLIEQTKEFIRKEWPEVADEYIWRCCSSVQIVDPFDGNNIELGERAETALDVSSADYPKLFKSAKDAACENYEEFLTKAEGDYDEEEYKTVRAYFQKS